MTSSNSQQAGSPPELWVEAVDRIEATDPLVLAFVDEADRRGRLACEQPEDGPLRGLPIGVKDLYRVDGLPTAAGSMLPVELFEGEQSWIVSALRAAGAVVVGKTTTDEFGYSEPPPTRNPRDLTRTPGGSSAGSAAAVAAGMVPLALGSQSLLSTIVPASYCGVVGYKPSYGRWPFDGVVAAASFDTLGFLGQDVATVTRAVSVLPGWTPEATERPILGVPHVWGVRRLHTEGWKAFGHHVEVLRDAGFEIRTAPVPWNDDWAELVPVIADLLNAEFAVAHREWFGRYRQLYRPKTADAIERGLAVDDKRLAACSLRRRSFIEELSVATESVGIDCWICPSAGSVAMPFDDSIRDSWLTMFWSLAGWPAISIPIFDGKGGLPHGVQVVVRHGQDEQLLPWAGELHRVFQESAAVGSITDVQR